MVKLLGVKVDLLFVACWFCVYYKLMVMLLLLQHVTVSWYYRASWHCKWCSLPQTTIISSPKILCVMKRKEGGNRRVLWGMGTVGRRSDGQPLDTALSCLCFHWPLGLIQVWNIPQLSAHCPFVLLTLCPIWTEVKCIPHMGKVKNWAFFQNGMKSFNVWRNWTGVGRVGKGRQKGLLSPATSFGSADSIWALRKECDRDLSTESTDFEELIVSF